MKTDFKMKMGPKGKGKFKDNFNECQTSSAKRKYHQVYTNCSNEIIIINLSLVNKDGKNISYVEGGPRKGRKGKCPSYIAFS
jgi:hypothetical protein